MSTDSVKRQLWLDVARGAGVILVVYGHVMRGLDSAGALPPEAWVRWSDFTLYSFHMPLFFFLSGVNVFHSLEKGRGAFISTRLWTIAWPYVLWSLIQGGIGVALAGKTNSSQTVGSLLRIGWEPIGQFWFLYALMLMQVLALLTRRRPMALLAISALCYCLSAWILHPTFVNAALHNVIFYALGAVLGPRLLAHIPSRRTATVVLVVSLATFVASTPLVGLITRLTPQSLLTLPCAAAGSLVVLAASWLAQGPIASGLAYVGRASMTVYVLHILAASGVRIVLKALHLDIGWSWNIVLGVALGVIAPTVAYALLKHFDLLWPLGLANRPRPRPAEGSSPLAMRYEN